jgi:hypothetical protein
MFPGQVVTAHPEMVQFPPTVESHATKQRAPPAQFIVQFAVSFEHRSEQSAPPAHDRDALWAIVAVTSQTLPPAHEEPQLPV